METLLEITNLEKQLESLHIGPIELTVECGTITTLVGRNGSGKSTLLKLIMNLVKPDQGNIKLLNIFTHGPDESWKQFIAYQPQTVIGWDTFTGQTLKEFIAPLYRDWDEELFQKMVSLFEIPLNRRFHRLSQGMQQKLTIALTIPKNTPLLLLDEPTSFMDIPAKQLLMDLLVDWIDQGDRAIIMTSHQSSDIMKLSDYINVLKNGKLIANFEKETLFATYQRYWLTENPPAITIPGEVKRTANYLISSSPEQTERFLSTQQIKWTTQEALKIEEIITLLTV
ncbi:ATP-binding cassette domain-containing protein [Virgibacillus proomii]|uniref:ATP-binding cassette domain-containing protein n=1 Tax=Virgibacillus proomii TaxID=84407 RepID=UPI001C1228BB|nr:ABC transporter ATP-binding protein [Virgibacillus proomii]MBU5266638.1 ABC transporter ATP-binding protein [Virgibacillus proomii]